MAKPMPCYKYVLYYISGQLLGHFIFIINGAKKNYFVKQLL